MRYIFRPEATPGDRLAETFSGPDRLGEEMAARLERGPVTHEMWVQVAGEGHDPHRADVGVEGLPASCSPATSWSPRSCPTRRPAARPTVFDPTRVVDGIELSDDPILRYRPARLLGVRLPPQLGTCH